LAFIGLDASARQRQAGIRAHIDKHLPIALDKFYAKIATVPAVASFFEGKAHMDRAQSKQVGHWKAIGAAQFDDAYFESSTRVGLRHAKIGLEPRWRIGGYGVIVETLIVGLVQDLMAEALQPKAGRFGKKAASAEEVMASANEMALVLASLIKSMLLDIDIGVSAYFDKLTEEAQAADEATRAKTARTVALTG